MAEPGAPSSSTAVTLPTSSWLPLSVRSRLLLAFAVLFLSAMILALVGWLGMRDTRDALKDFQSHVLPDVTRSLELSQRTAAIAAMAPYVAESNRPFQLQAEADALRMRLAEAEQLAITLPRNKNNELDVQPALLALKSSIEELIEVTRSDLFLQEDLREYLYRLERARNNLSARTPAVDKIDALLRDSALAIEVNDPRVLKMLHEQVSQQIARIDRNSLEAAQVANLIRDNLEGPDNVFILRARQSQLRERKTFLVARTRAEAERLGERVDTYVRSARQSVDKQSASINRAVNSGVLGIGLLTLVCIAVAGLGMRVVVRMVSSLGGITQIMSRLAQGDTEQTTLETARRDELGALARAFEVFRDNARAVRRLASDMLEQTNLLATVVESMKDGLSVFDRDGRLITWNRQYPALLRLPSEAIVHGMTLEQIQELLPAHINEHGNAPTVLGELNFARQNMAYRFELSFPGGRVVEFRSNPMPGGGFVTLYSDLTERRAVEAQLRQAQKMEVLGQLTGGVAHDFNNLLAAITGNLYLLEESGELSPAGQRFAGRARSASERGATLTRRLLAFARRQPLSPTAVDIDMFIGDLADLIEYSIGQGVRLELELHASPACAWVDRGQMENALLNLAINARDAMPTGGTLTLRTHQEDGTGMVCIEVADSGQGMDEETRERVFEPFFTTKGGSGNGLGLSIVYGFVKQSGGEIELKSRVGEGSVFVLRLPTQAHRPDTEGLLQTEVTHAGEQAILLVEDDPDVRQALSDLLRATGHTVTEASSVSDALEILRHTHQTLVISDVDFGGKTHGVELMRQIASAYPSLPRILMSGLPAEILISRFGLEPHYPLLPKPFTIQQLDTAIREAMALFQN